MTRAYAAARLLEHGPLTFSEFLAITGWRKQRAWAVLETLVSRRVVQFTEALGCRRRVYMLVGGIDA
jgi:DNA-binding transcriptional regulator GbsR (MarR family)